MLNTAESQDIAFQPASKGYSYSDSEMSAQGENKKKRGMLFSLGLEIAGLLLLFFIFLAILNYFSIISLNPINPTLFGWLPKQSSDLASTSTTINSVNNHISPTPAFTNDILTVSDVPGYTLKTVDTVNLISYLNAMQIWGKTFNQAAESVAIHRIIFHLSNRKGTDDNLYKDSSGTSIYTSEFIFKNNQLDLYIYLFPNILSQSDSGKIYNDAVFTDIKNLSNQSTNDKTKLESILNTYLSKNISYFKIEKGT